MAANHDVVVTAIRRPKPVDAPPDLALYAAPPRFEQLALSADGAQVAMVTDIGAARLLVAYRFADKSKRFVKLGQGAIADVSWADSDHVLIDVTRPALRGTCDAKDQNTIVKNNFETRQNLQNVLADLESPPPGQPLNPGAADGVRKLLDDMHLPPCVYYGVRSEDAVTVINLNTHRGRTLGQNFGGAEDLSLGPPVATTIGGRAQLIGPFLELRSQTVGNEPAERAYLWRADPDSGDGKVVDDGGGDVDRESRYVDDWLVDRDGALVARGVIDFATKQFSLQMNANHAWKPVLTRTVLDQDHTFAPFMIGFGAARSSVVILDVGAKDGAYHYYQLSADGTLTGPLEPADALTDRPIFDPATGRLAGFSQTGESDSYAVSDPQLSTLFDRAQSAAPGETVRVVSLADDPRKLVIRAQGPQDPGSYFYIDFVTGRSQALGEDYAEIATEWIAEQKPITYKAADGLDIHALLTLPPSRPDPTGLPLVVLPHDGPRGYDAQGFDWLAQALASRGYVVLQPNYRGSDGYGPALIAAGAGELGGKMQGDLTDGVRELVSEGLVDPRRVCLLGVGFGGYAALTAAATQGDAVRCAGAINGVTDVARQQAWDQAKQMTPFQDQITSLIPDPHTPRAFIANPGSPSLLAAYVGPGRAPPSPVALAGAVTAPVLLIDTLDDRLVPSGESQALRDALTAARKPVQLIELKGDEHAPTSEATRLAILNAVIDFLAKNNPAG